MSYTEELKRLSGWLRDESVKRSDDAASRRDGAAAMKNATTKELRESKRTAEQMAGHKLTNVSASVESARSYADTQDRIASQLETESRRLASGAYLCQLSKGHENGNDRMLKDHQAACRKHHCCIVSWESEGEGVGT
jgi:hypothetical protein